MDDFGFLGASSSTVDFDRTSASADQLASRVDSEHVKGMEDREMRRVSQEFEAMFVRQLIKVMRQSSKIEEDGEGLFDSDRSTQMYMEIADDHLAQHVSEQGAFGISEMVYDFLKQNQQSVYTAEEVAKKLEANDGQGMSLETEEGTNDTSKFMSLPQKGAAPSTEDFMRLKPEGWQGIDLNTETSTGFMPLSKKSIISTDELEKR